MSSSRGIGCASQLLRHASIPASNGAAAPPGWNPTSKPANELGRQGDTDRDSSPYARGNRGGDGLRGAARDAASGRLTRGHNPPRAHHKAMNSPVVYMTTRPAMRPPAVNGVHTVSGLCRATILYSAATTCMIAPTPMLSNSVAHSGE